MQLDSDDKLTNQILDAWGQSWGIFLRTTTHMEKLRKHLRQFLRVEDPRGKHLVFRFYDPHVLRVFLPTCRIDELRTFFGPVDSFVMENEDDGVVEFTFDGRGLAKKTVP